MTLDKDFLGFGLHDAVLDQLTVDWPDGIVVIRLSATTPRQEQVVITATGIVELACPRRQPWGTGDHVFYVNDVRMIETAGCATKQLELEMGSGDVLMVVATHFEKVIGPKSAPYSR